MQEIQMKLQIEICQPSRPGFVDFLLRGKRNPHERRRYAGDASAIAPDVAPLIRATLAALIRINRHCEPTGRANARPMTGSAKQSIEQNRERVDCFVAALLAMTTNPRRT